MAKELPITEFDMLTIDESTQMFKAMIPFLDYPLQKTLSLIIRANEFSQTLRFYNTPLNSMTLKTQSTSHTYINSINDMFTNDDFLNTVMQYCPEKYAKMIDQFRSFSKVSEIMNLFQGFDEGTDLFNNPIILNMMNQSVNNTDKENTSNSSSQKNNTSKKEEPHSKEHKEKTSAASPDLLSMLLTPKQQKEYDTYMKTLKNL